MAIPGYLTLVFAQPTDQTRSALPALRQQPALDAMVIARGGQPHRIAAVSPVCAGKVLAAAYGTAEA